jgi:phosphoglycerate dehydrogenase-like enzyme
MAEGIEPSFGTDGATLDRDLEAAQVLVGFRIPTDRLTSARNLRLIQLTGAGLDHLLPLDWLPGTVSLATASGAHSVKIGEYAAMALLMLNNRIPHYADAKVARRWAPLFTSAIAGKTVLIVGVGSMGGAAATSANALGLRVIGIRPSSRSHPSVDEMHGPAELDVLLPEADFLLIATPLTSKTRGMIGQRQLQLMKRGSGLINIGRAPLVDYVALAAELKSGKLSGAVLDVFHPEPLPPDSFIWDTPNLVMTPHVSSDDETEYVSRVLEVLFENVRRLRAGRPYLNRVDPAREY